jgi:hypothetical protein
VIFSGRELEPRAAAQMQAWRRPGWVVAVWGFRTMLALLVAGPLAGAAGALVSGYPRGDAELFDGGAVMLVELARVIEPLAPALTAQAGAIFALAAVVGLLPMAALVVAIGHRGPVRLGAVLGRAAERMGALALLLGVALLVQAFCLVAPVLGAESVIARMGWTPPREDVARTVGIVVGVVLALLAGIVHDLARVAAVQRRLGFYDAGAMGLKTFGRSFGRALGGYAWRAALTGLVLALGYYLVTRLPIEGRGTLVMPWVLHQTALLLAVALRASWLAAAMRLVEARAPRLSELDLMPLDESDLEPATAEELAAASSRRPDTA